jgi:hypothetical protein
MKTYYLFSALLIFISVHTSAQWQADFRLTNDPANSGLSQNNAKSVAASGSAVHVVWYDERDGNKEIYYKRSTDNGLTWGTDTRLTNNPFTSSVPSVSVSGQVVHVTWVDDRDGDEEIYYKCSTDNGITWGADMRLTNSMGTSENPSLSVSGLFVHIVWEDNRDGNYEIYYKRSADGGVNWSSDMRLTNNPSYSSPPSIAASDSTLHVVWADNRDGNIEIYYKRSSDSGISWGTDTRLTNDPNYSGDASVAVSGSNVYVAWSDQRDGFLINEVYCKTSTDGGISWGTDTRLTYALAFASAPSVAVAGSNVHVVWHDGRDANYFEIYYKGSTDGGLTWHADTRLTNDSAESEFPSVAIQGSVVHTVWSDVRDGNYEIYYKGNPTGNSLGTDELFADNSIHIYPNPVSNSSTISFSLSQSQKVYIKVVDVSGRLVATLADKIFEKGENKIVWNAADVIAGIYFLKMNAGDASMVTKILKQ